MVKTFQGEPFMKTLAAFFIVLSLILLSSCAKTDNPDCRVILSEMISAEIGLPSGKIYSSRAEDGDAEYLSDHLLNSLYGEGKKPVMAEGWLDIALFLPSLAHPCEFAVILCDSEDTATDTARMLCRRLDAIRTTKSEGEYAQLTENATVTVIGNYALLIISSDTENAIKSASKIIG